MEESEEIKLLKRVFHEPVWRKIMWERVMDLLFEFSQAGTNEEKVEKAQKALMDFTALKNLVEF